MRQAPFNLGLVVVMLMLGRWPGQAQLYRPLIPPLSGNSNALTVIWEPSPSEQVAGYALYWGVNGSPCTNRIMLRNVTNTTLAGFKPGDTYQLAVAAYDAAGEESPWSNRIEYRRPPKASSTAVVPKLELDPIHSSGTNSLLRLGFLGQPGVTYLLQSSEDLRHWVTISTTNCPGEQQVEFKLPFTANVPQRFFRLVQP